MSYSTLTYHTLSQRFGLRQQAIDWLPESPSPVHIPELERAYRRVAAFPANSEKARSEIYVMPLLLELWDRYRQHCTLFSGERVDAEPEQGLSGECDFLFCAKPRLVWVEAPVICVIEAKREDLEVGRTQCAAQLVGMHRFNAQNGQPIEPLVGCTTDGDRWQFLRLREGHLLEIDPRVWPLSDLGRLLGLWTWVLGQYFELEP
jgi:hypothetical protein